MVESSYKVKVGTFYLDSEQDIGAYEEIVNNENCRLMKKETIKVKEETLNYDEGKLASADKRERICWVVEYEVMTVK